MNSHFVSTKVFQYRGPRCGAKALYFCIRNMDDICDLSIYLSIYICVCVCVCVCDDDE
jgi:hypothetical protein